MTAANTQLDRIKTALQSALPSVLTAAGLDDFDAYVIDSPQELEKNTLAVYLMEEVDDRDFYYFRCMVQCQLPRVRNVTDYHSSILPVIRATITPALLGLDYRSSIAADVWPLNKNVATSYIYYEIEFTEELDDCD